METSEYTEIENTGVEEKPAMARGLFFKALVALHGLKWASGFALILAAGVALSILIDWEIIIITLMVLFIVMPAVIMFLYFFHALKPLTLLNTTPHLYEMDTGVLTIQLTETGRIVDTDCKELTLYSEFGKGVIYTTPKKGWIWIGEVFFDEKEDFIFFIEQLNKEIKNESHTR